MPDAVATAPWSDGRGEVPLSMRRLEMVRATGTKMWVWGAVAPLTIGMVGFGGPATAAPPATNNSPVATASAEVRAGNNVVVTYRSTVP